MNLLKKKVAAVTLGAVLTVTGLLGGLMLNNSAITASAEEVMPVVTITVDEPYIQPKSLNTAVRLRYYGDDTEDLTTYICLGTDENPNRGHITYYGNYYDVIAVPSVGDISVRQKYWWMQAFVIESGETYSSSRVVFNTSATYSARYPITGSIVSGSLSATTTTLSYSAGNHTDVYFTCVYNGKASNGSLSIPSSGYSYMELAVNGVYFYVNVYNSSITVSTSKTIGCSQYSAVDSGYGAFAYSVW